MSLILTPNDCNDLCMMFEKIQIILKRSSFPIVPLAPVAASRNKVGQFWKIANNSVEIMDAIDNGSILSQTATVSWLPGRKDNPRSSLTKPFYDYVLANGPVTEKQIIENFPSIKHKKATDVIRELKKQNILIEASLTPTATLTPEVPQASTAPLIPEAPQAPTAIVTTITDVASDTPIAPEASTSKKPPRKLTDEQKAKMKAGRYAAIAKKKADMQASLASQMQRIKEKGE